jgi:hypothetical protein
MILVSKTKGLRPLDPHQGSALDPPGQVPWTPINKRRGENGDGHSSRTAAEMAIPVLTPFFLLLGVWGLRPQRGRGAEPPWGVQGGKAPLALRPTS